MHRISLMMLFVLLTLPSINYSMAAGIQIGKTRVIYDAQKKEVALPLINKGSELPWLIQSWVDSGDGKTRGPFIVTPPLFRLDARTEQSLRIVWSGGALPLDRESLFFINVRTIPASDKNDDDKNVLRLIYKTRLKLFYRPEGLPGTPTEACEHLQFSLNGTMLQVSNPSAYHIVFDSLYVSDRLLPNADTVAPKSTTSLPVPAAISSRNVAWRCITDYGNASEKFRGQMDNG
ncbi:molecular chaperone [Trabulsiella odontotermitis]|uniref:fimbrial biogenesis chaperone n=1 Tax=Trabulsiella odontotermitis TaxID=379893 RepID=UPI0024B7A4B5|nr:molecular chaperone [Trabulsiella odontotermitis]WHP29733.1 molecular chaperone [Trabulsiella odontotermitis]